MAQTQYELKMPYGIGFTLVGRIRGMNVPEMTIETEWEARQGLELNLAHHFPREKGGKPFFPGVLQIEYIAARTNIAGYRIVEIRDAIFTGMVSPGELTAQCAYRQIKPEHEVEPLLYEVANGEVWNVLEKRVCQANLLLEKLDVQTTILGPRARTSALPYSGNEILVPSGPNLPNSVLAEHMSQSVVAMNAHVPEFEGKQFLLTGIPEAKFFSDVPWNGIVVSRGGITVDADDKRRGSAHVETYLDDAPIAMMEMTFAALPLKKQRA